MTPAVRIGDAERERAAADLAEHFTHGRLSNDEYDERLDAIWTARTAADLAPIFEDLPVQRPVPAQQRRRLGPRPAWERLRTLPLVPVLAVLIVLSVVTGWPFWVLIFLLGCGVLRHGHRARRWG